MPSVVSLYWDAECHGIECWHAECYGTAINVYFFRIVGKWTAFTYVLEFWTPDVSNKKAIVLFQ